MSQHPSPRRSFSRQVMFVLLIVCCLRPTLTLANSNDDLQYNNTAAPDNALTASHSQDSEDPPNYGCELCPSSPSRDHPKETDVLTTEPSSPETPLSLHKSNNTSSTQELSSGKHLNRLEIILGVFFCIIVCWLAFVIVYTLLTMFVVRLQSEGRLDINDLNFGQVSCCCVKLQLAFLLRYAVPLDNANGNISRSFRRLVTRSERRSAMEVLLLQNENPSSNVAVVVAESDPACCALHVEGENKSDEDHDETHSIEEACCSICLGEYDDSADIKFTCTTCSHCFHKDCILDWLEQQDNTNCPCCRVPMVDNSKIYKQVKRLREAKRKQNATQNEHPGIFVKCLQCLFQQRWPNSSASDDEGPTESASQSDSPTWLEQSTNSRSWFEQSSLDIEEQDADESSSPVVLQEDATDLPPPSSEMEVGEGITLESGAPIGLQEQAEATQENLSPSTDLEYPILVRHNGGDEDVETGPA